MARFEVKIKGMLYYRTDRPVEIMVMLKNISKRDYYVRVVNTPFEEFPSDCFKITKGGKKIVYDGIHLKRGESPSDYVLLAAGATRYINHRISDGYNLNETGLYKIQMNPDFIRYHMAEDNGRNEYDCRERLSSVKKVLFIRKGTDQRQTLGAQARLKEKLMLRDVGATNLGYVTPRIEDCNSTHTETEKNTFKKLVREAHAQMIAYMEHSERELKSMIKSDNNEHYQMIFGNYTIENHNKAKEVIEKVFNAMKVNAQIAYERNCNPKYEKSGIFGYTYQGTNTIYLCPAYLNAKLSGEDSRLGRTHAIAFTTDVVYNGETMYGRKNCRMLAEKDREIAEEKDKAVNNADSYEFFLETQFLNWGNEKTWTDAGKFDRYGLGGPAVEAYMDKIHVFYKNTENQIGCAFGGKEASEEVSILVDRGGLPFETFMHPETVIFKGELYLFYIPKGEKQLYYTRKTESGWEEGKGVRDTKNPICPLYPPQPVVYKDSICLIYKKTSGSGFFMTTWNGGNVEWTDEKSIDNQMGLAETPHYNPAVAVYNDTLYIFYQILTENEDQKNQIFYRIYKEELDTWKRGILNQNSDLDVRSQCEMRAAVSGDSLYLWAENPIGTLIQIRMNIPLTGEKRPFFTDGEIIRKNTLKENIPNIGSRCAFAALGKNNFLFYFKIHDNKIVFSRQASGL